MEPGDLVILSRGNPGVVMEVVGIYEYADPPNVPPMMRDYLHQRAAQVVRIDADRLWRAAGAVEAEGEIIYQALVRCDRPISGLAVAGLLY
jgi:hypothetical protein